MEGTGGTRPFRLHKESTLVREVMSMREVGGTQVRWCRNWGPRQGGEPQPGRWGTKDPGKQKRLTALPIMAFYYASSGVMVQKPEKCMCNLHPLPGPVIPLQLSSEMTVIGVSAKPRA